MKFTEHAFVHRKSAPNIQDWLNPLVTRTVVDIVIPPITMVDVTSNWVTLTVISERSDSLRGSRYEQVQALQRSSLTNVKAEPVSTSIEVQMSLKWICCD